MVRVCVIDVCEGDTELVAILLCIALSVADIVILLPSYIYSA